MRRALLGVVKVFRALPWPRADGGVASGLIDDKSAACGGQASAQPATLDEWLMVPRDPWPQMLAPVCVRVNDSDGIWRGQMVTLDAHAIGAVWEHMLRNLPKGQEQ